MKRKLFADRCQAG